MTKLTTVGSKKAVEPKILSGEILLSTTKRSNFEQVAVGICPHDNGNLGDEIRGSGVGFSRTCESCGHTWYINKKIHTCKCLTCSGTKRNATELLVGQGSEAHKSGGPFWARTRDLSLIRNGASALKRRKVPLNIGQPSEYVEAWYKEQQLKGIANLTLYCYRQKIDALLNEYPMPNIVDIKEYLSKKQESGYYSGTIANYVKAFRSFFGYLFTRGLYDLDPSCLSLPKIRHKEKHIPRDEEIAKLLSVPDRAEDIVALLLLIDCGIRIHELTTIKIKNINLDDTSILINGKGDKARTVYLSETTVSHLRSYIQTCEGEYLFPSTRADAKIPHRCNRYFEKR